MPNHVSNSLTIAGSKEDIEKIKKELQHEEEEDGKKYHSHFSFKKIIPMPDHIYRGSLGKAEEEKYGKENCWYDWSVKNWGTKWDAYSQPAEEPQIVTSSNALRFIKGQETLCMITYFFNTAWSPVGQVIDALSRKYPEVLIRYDYACESGDFAGVDFMKNGEILVEYDYSDDTDKKDEIYSQKGYEPEILVKQFKEVVEDYL